MRIKATWCSQTVVVALLLSVSQGTSLALNGASHETVNEQAARTSGLDNVMKEQLGMSDGILTGFKGSRALQWIRLGGTLEDDGTVWEMLNGRARPLRHFHDPLRAWDQSGLSMFQLFPPRFARYESSPRWAQRVDQNRETGYGNYSWPSARQYFLTALTDPDPTRRQQGFADTFRALGQIMHLIGDASVPEHVRNDPHPMGTIQDKFGQVGNYEYWVLAQHRKKGTEPQFIQQFLSTLITLDPALLEIPIPETESVARVPIARLFDSDRYTGSNPEVTAESRIGIAEITNANFVSQDTGNGEYPHPALADMPKYIGTYLKIGEKRAYYRKSGAGLAVDPVAAECAFDELTGAATFCPDDDVWRETARHMLPRAVRYAQEVLDYFFRGKLDFDVYPSFENAGQLDLTFYNRSAEAMTGSFTLYTEDKDGKRVPVPGAFIEGLTLSGVPNNLGPPPDPGTPENPEVPPENSETPPENYVPDSHTITFTPDPAVKLRGLTLVFSGALGAEQGAVVGKVKPWEPPIFVIQEFAELTSPEQVETHDWCLDPETGGVCWWKPFNSATNIRSKDPRLQRAGGHFAAPDGSDAGEFIKRIWLMIGAPPPAEQGITLRVNGDIVADREWSREKGPALVPKTWEIVVDLTQSSDPSHVIALPMLVVETQSGRQEWSNLIWWRENKSYGQIWYSYCYGCCPKPRSVLVQSITSAWNEVEASFGNEFIPIEGIRGFEVGTYISLGGLTNSWDTCPAEESSSDQFVLIFVDEFHMPTDRAIVSQGQSARWWVDESNFDAYAKPPGPPPDAPQMVQQLRFRPQYSSNDMQSYQLQGITPPEYEIELR